VLVQHAFLTSLAALATLLWRERGGVRILVGVAIASVVGAGLGAAWQLALQVHVPGLPSLAQAWGSAASLAACLLAGMALDAANPAPRSKVKVLRGTRIVESGEGWCRDRSAERVHLAGVPVPAGDEAKHFKLIGTTGTGKSTAIHGLVEEALARGDRAVIADPDGILRERFEDRARGDRALNPLDRDTDGWDLAGEVDSPADADALARALLPEQGGDDRAWRQYARVYVASLVRQLFLAGVRDPGELHRLIGMAELDELRVLLESTAAAAYVSSENGRFFASVRAIAASDLAALEAVALQRVASRVSIRAWMRRDMTGGGGVLFLPYRANQLPTIRGLISAWLRLAIFEVLSMPASQGPVWFVIDELDALGAIDGLKDALTRLRKYDGRCILGIQSIAQLSGTYGAPAAQTIVENCGNTLLLRCSAGEQGGTSRFASMLIGDREVLRTQQSRTRPMGFGRAERTRSESMQHHVERAVLPAEIEQLADLEGYLKFASEPAWRRVKIRSAVRSGRR
jgi:type IV secretory pathway TraG/TraD family ATPase VirD4